jgi:uncharacterized protein (DUF2336 family)
MMTTAFSEFISELEVAVKAVSPERRVRMLRQVTGLLLSSANRLSEHQIAVFDDVLVRLVDRIEAPTLAKLSSTLADLAPAPEKTVRQLACHEEAKVAAPVLLKSKTLAETDLVGIASARGQEHLIAIAGRQALSEPLTDILLTQGDTNVRRRLAKHTGARFSARGYSILVAAAGRDDEVADCVVLRSDVPATVLRELLAKATKTVRTRLLRVAPPAMREAIQAIIASVEADAPAKLPARIDYCDANSRVLELNKAGRLNDSTVNRFAVRGEHTNLVAALSLLAAAAIETIEPLMEEGDGYGLMIACRASRLNWTTTQAVINSGTGVRRVPPRQVEALEEAFEALCLSTAQWTIRFGSVDELAAKCRSPGHIFALAEASP